MEHGKDPKGKQVIDLVCDRSSASVYVTLPQVCGFFIQPNI